MADENVNIKGGVQRNTRHIEAGSACRQPDAKPTKKSIAATRIWRKTAGTAPGRFITPLHLEQIPARAWWDVLERHFVIAPLVYRDRQGHEWTVDAGFDTDLASVPRTWLFIVVCIGVIICGVGLGQWL